MKRAFLRMINLTKWNKHKMDCHTSHTHNQQHRFLPNNLLLTTHFICQPLSNLWSTLYNIFSHFYEHASKENKILNGFARCCVGRGNEVEQDCMLESGMTANTKKHLKTYSTYDNWTSYKNRNHGNTILYFCS